MNKVIANVLNLPCSVRTTRKSINDIIKDSGILEHPEQFREEGICSYLEENPNLIDEWFQWSQDKRTWGWYIVKNDDDNFTVGYLTQEALQLHERIFADKVSTVSFFIRQEIDEYQNSLA